MKPRPSNAHLWTNCSASLLAEESSLSESAQEGIIAHKQTQEALSGHPLTLDDEVYEYVREVKALGPSVNVERKIDIAAISPTSVGYIDAVHIQDEKATIIDFKYGHRHVSAVNNPQLILYADALRHVTPQLTKFELRIIQPRVYHGERRSVSHMTNLMIDQKIAQFKVKLDEARTNNHKATTGIHCRDCPMRTFCSANQEASLNIIDVINTPFNENHVESKALAWERKELTKAQAMLKSRLEAIDDTLTHRIENGDLSSGLTLESIPGRKKWTQAAPLVIQEVSTKYGIDIAKLECKTPTQAASMLPASKRESFYRDLSNLWGSSSTKKLVELKESTASTIFNT